MLRTFIRTLLPGHASTSALALALYGTGHSEKAALCCRRSLSSCHARCRDGPGSGRSDRSRPPPPSPIASEVHAAEELSHNDNDNESEEENDDGDDEEEDDELWFRGEDSDSWERLNGRLDLGFLEDKDDSNEDGGDRTPAHGKENTNGASCGPGVPGGFPGLGMRDSIDDPHNVKFGFLGLGRDSPAESRCYLKDDVKGRFSGLGTDNSVKFRYMKDDVKGGFSGIGIDDSVMFQKMEDDVEAGFLGSRIDDSAKFRYDSVIGADDSVKSHHRYAKDDDKGTFSGLEMDNSSNLRCVNDDVKGRFSGLGIDDSAKFHTAEVGFSGLGIDNSSRLGYYVKDNVNGRLSDFGADNSVESCRYAKDDNRGAFSGLGRDDSVKFRYAKDSSKGGFPGLGIDNSVKFRNEEDDVKGGLSGLGRDDSVKFRYAKGDAKGGYSGLEEGNSVNFRNVKDDAKVAFSGLGIDPSIKFCYAKDDAKGRFSGLGIDNSVQFRDVKGDVKGRFSGLGIDNSVKFCNVKDNAKCVFSGSETDNSVKFCSAEDDDEDGFSGLGTDNSVKFCHVKDDVKGGFSGSRTGDPAKFGYAKDEVKGGFSGSGLDNSVKISHVEDDVKKGLFSGFSIGDSVQIRHHTEEDDAKASFSSCFGIVDNSVRIRYVRYYDKILVGMEVGRDDVKIIQDRLMDFLRDDLKMEVGSSVTHLGAGKVKFLGTVLQGVPFPKLPKSSKEMEMRKRVKHRIKQAATQRRAAIQNRIECLGKNILAQQLKKGKKETGSIEKAGILLADTFKAAGVTAQTDILKETAKAVQQNSRDILRSLGWSHMPPDVQQAFSRLDDSLGAWMSSIDTRIKPQKAQKSWNAWDRNGPISEYSIKIFAPLHEIVQRLRDRGLLTEKKVLPTHLARLSTRPDEDIVNWYSSVAYGLLAYYRCCDNFDKVRSLVDYHLRWSAIYTLARKHKCSAHQIIQKHSKDLRVFDGEAQILAEYPNTFELRMLRREFLDTTCFNTVNMGKILAQELIRYSRSRK